MPTSRISFQSVNADDQVEVSSDRTSVFVTVLEVGYRGWKSRQITERKKKSDLIQQALIQSALIQLALIQSALIQSGLIQSVLIQSALIHSALIQSA